MNAYELQFRQLLWLLDGLDFNGEDCEGCLLSLNEAGDDGDGLDYYRPTV